MKELMLTNEAVARGAYEAGVRVLSAYPGTPSTEIAENFVKYDDVSYTGVNGGLVIVVADDPGMHSSQNEQDTRYYARSAHIPLLEPSDAQEAKDFVALAFDISEKYDTPVILRLTTRVAHSRSLVELGERVKPYEKSVTKYAMMPASAIIRHRVVEERDCELAELSDTISINRAEYTKSRIGVVCSGVVYEYVKEALPNANVFKVGMVHPLPVKAIAAFAQKVSQLFVVEELEPFMEDRLKTAGVKCRGKGELTSLQGELGVAKLLEKFERVPIPVPDKVPGRPPVMCAGCPHRGVFYVLSKLKLTVNGDIGCYTLGAQPPLAAVDTVLCMGASIGMAHGFKKATDGTSHNIAVIGDSTFLHSGITGLINAVYNQSGITLVILDNSTTGMTGHQDHPATGKNLKGEPAPAVLLDDLCRACGVKEVSVVDAYDLAAVENAVKAGLASPEVSVIIAQRPCVLLDRSPKPKAVVSGCRNCGKCLKLGCPAISRSDKGVAINPVQCTGCGL